MKRINKHISNEALFFLFGQYLTTFVFWAHLMQNGWLIFISVVLAVVATYESIVNTDDDEK